MSKEKATPQQPVDPRHVVRDVKEALFHASRLDLLHWFDRNTEWALAFVKENLPEPGAESGATPMNPRYVLWQKVTGGTKNHEYIIWMNDQWRDWRKDKGYSATRSASPADHEDFDTWMRSRWQGTLVQPTKGAPTLSPRAVRKLLMALIGHKWTTKGTKDGREAYASRTDGDSADPEDSGPFRIEAEDTGRRYDLENPEPAVRLSLRMGFVGDHYDVDVRTEADVQQALSDYKAHIQHLIAKRRLLAGLSPESTKRGWRTGSGLVIEVVESAKHPGVFRFHYSGGKKIKIEGRSHTWIPNLERVTDEATASDVAHKIFRGDSLNRAEGGGRPIPFGVRRTVLKALTAAVEATADLLRKGWKVPLLPIPR